MQQLRGWDRPKNSYRKNKFLGYRAEKTRYEPGIIISRKCSLALLNHKEVLWHRKTKGMAPKHWILLLLY